MRSLYFYSTLRASGEDNNFLLIRLVACVFVIIGHSYFLAPRECGHCVDFMLLLTRSWPSHVLGVQILFLVSGFLVATSYRRHRSFVVFMLLRAVRILPGYFVCILLMGLAVGLFYTEQPWRSYLAHVDLHRYLLNNLSLRMFVDNLPDVRFSARQGGATVNGSLWTIPVEVRLYLLVGLAGFVGVLRTCCSANLVIAALLAVLVYMIEFAGGGSVAQLSLFFLMGVFFCCNSALIPLSMPTLLVMLVGAFIIHGQPGFRYYLAFVLSYAVLSFAYAPRVPLPVWLEDYSYGIYLYGYPAQQIVARHYAESGPYELMMMGLPIACIMGLFSWHAIEKPAIRYIRMRLGQAHLVPGAAP